MRRLANKFTFWATTLAFLTVSAFAQTVSIQGDVKGEDGKPLPNAVIKIDRKDMKAAYKTKTDKKGHYIYAGLPFGGTFKVTLEVDSKDVNYVDNVRPRGEPAEVNFDIAKIKAEQAAAAGAGPAAAPQADPEKGMNAAQKAEYEKAKKEQEAAMAKNKELNDAFAAGMAGENSKNWNDAIAGFEKASGLDAKQHVVWSHLADAYAMRNQAGDMDKAVGAYKTAVELKPEDAGYHNNYGLILAKAKKFDEAQAELAKAAQIDPPQAGKYFYNLGAVYVNTGQNDAAEAAFKRTIDADPNYADAWFQMGIVLLGKATTSADGKVTPPAGTADAFQKYLALRPDGANAETAKAMLQSLGATVSTTFEQKKQPAAKKK